MTELESLKYIKLFREEWDVNSKTKNAEALDVAIKALEKQIAKKPIDRCMFKECPDCHEIEIQYCNYCPTCGQKLDWSDEDDNS